MSNVVLLCIAVGAACLAIGYIAGNITGYTMGVKECLNHWNKTGHP